MNGLLLCSSQPIHSYGETQPRSDAERNASAPSARKLNSSRLCTQVCLSVPLGWAWLQGNSRGRRRPSAVPALPGFGFPPGLPASPFAVRKQSAPDPPKNSFAGLESGPLLLRVAPTDRGTKGRQTHALQKSHHSHWFSRPGRRKPLDTKRYRLYALIACHQRELERERQQRVQDAH